MAERFLDEISRQYPLGSEKLEHELIALKRKLDETEFSDADENEMCDGS